MPFKTIINAALILTGMEESTESTRHRWEPPEDHAARGTFEILIIGALLGKLAATSAREWRINERFAVEWSEEGICGWSIVDLDDARAFVRSSQAASPDDQKKESLRDKQLRLLQAKAKELKIDLLAPVYGQKKQLQNALDTDHPGKFSNFKDIWQAALDAGIAKPIAR